MIAGRHVYRTVAQNSAPERPRLTRVQGLEHPLPAVRSGAVAALASLSPAACTALGEEEMQRVWGWLRRAASADSEPAAAVRAAAAKTVGSLAQLPHSLQYPGASIAQL